MLLAQWREESKEVEGIVAKIHEGGRAHVLGLIDMLTPPDDPSDHKAHYALHCLGVHLLEIEDDEPRQVFGEALASRLGDDTPVGVRKYLCQELQTAGGPEAVAALGKLLTHPELCEPAARALVAIGDGACEPLLAALSKVKDKCRLTLVQNLGAAQCKKAVAALTKALGAGDAYVRIAAAWSLANIGHPDAVAPVFKTADVEPGWERIQKTKACLVLAEKLLAAGEQDAAKTMYQLLRDSRKDPAEAYVREAAEQALAGM
ncbi:MAG: HEAT repeat domain-containing protein, partial [Planctomycetota bacterium]